LNVKNLPFANAPTSLIFVSQCNKFEFYLSSSTPLLDSKNKVLRRPVELTALSRRSGYDKLKGILVRLKLS